jgi:hypothetical protein
MIAIHKDVQKKIFEEVDANYEGGDVEMEDLHKYKYIEMVIKEALRLFPTVPFVPRKVTQEFQMKEYTIPKDTILIDFLYHMHRNTLYWGDDANDFRPERFEPEEIKKIHPHAYAPFAGEKRIFLMVLEGAMRHSFFHSWQTSLHRQQVRDVLPEGRSCAHFQELRVQLDLQVRGAHCHHVAESRDRPKVPRVGREAKSQVTAH